MIDPQFSDEAPQATPTTLRQFAALWIVFFGAFAVQAFRHGNTGLSITLALLAGTVGPLGLLRPQAIKLIFDGMMLVAFPIGWAVSHVLLGALFYGVFTPVALLFKLIKRDPLRRRRADRDSYWSPKTMPSDLSNYFHEY